ncbi:hypothetical protein K8353_50025, partial [Burkholderia contaminans]|nr:hypothetical protein [Burkholderia contaminans]
MGAGRPRAARMAAYTSMFLAATELIIVGGALFASRHIFGYTFSNDMEVVHYVSQMAPL